MHEQHADIEWLAAIIGSSIEAAGPYLRASFQMPDHSLGARQLINHLKAPVTVAIATVSASGQPLVSPLMALLYRARLYAPTLGSSARVRHLRRQPSISLTYFEENDFAVIVHGKATLVREPDEDFQPVEEIMRQATGGCASEWGEDPVYIRIDPERIYTFARYPERFSPGDL